MKCRKVLAILSSSTDATSDVLVELARECGQDIIRWNVDLWRHYDLSFDGHKFLVSDPVGRTADLAACETILLWRKPFLDQMGFEGLDLRADDESQARSQVREWLHAIVSLAGSEGRLRLVDPHGDRRVPKLFQLQVAHSFFSVPRSHFGISGTQSGLGPNTITKPLGDPSVSDGQIFFTQRVDAMDLFRPFPWFVQDALIGGRDVTCVYILGNCHFYVCEFARNEDAVDWRVEINTQQQSRWQPLQHAHLTRWAEATDGFMRRINLRYGRLDFILQDDDLVFLECNSNGQFGWLDDTKSLSLHREFFSAALRARSAVRV